MRELYVFRHGESVSNVKGVYNTGDDVLTDAGREQVRRAAPFIRSLGLDAVFVSPLARTMETAQLIGLPFIEEGRLIDWAFGVFAGKPFGSFGQYIRERGLDKRSYVPEGGESLEAFHERVSAFLRELPSHGKFLIISHAGVIKNIVHAETGHSWEQVHAENAALWLIRDAHIIEQNWKPWDEQSPGGQ